MSNLVITIGRQYGSGGAEIGKRLAQELGIKFYDKELINLAAKESGFSEQILKDYDEKPTNSFLYSLSLGSYSYDSTSFGNINVPITDKVFMAQAQIIRDLAEKEPCVIIGRCAESVLKNHDALLSVFIHSDIERRIERICEKKNVTRAQASDMIKKIDKKRASYHNYFSDGRWGEAAEYDICLDSKMGIENVVKIIKYCAENKLF
ncbi:MAG: cytidylate kinase-like family protein [Ruminococcaceae bacterium]|nr:cytidylate kinase-like family protein [Oscillospiraceae bacterium]